MATVIFVHGTGVREPAVSKTFEIVQGEIAAEKPLLKVTKCYWAQDHGARLHKDGASIPQYDTARAINIAESAESEETMLWRLLYDDPLYEVRQMGAPLAKAEEGTPGETPAWWLLLKKVELLKPSPALLDRLKRYSLDELWNQAIDALASEDIIKGAFQSTIIPPGEQRSIMARAVAAELTVLGEAKGIPPVDSSLRDEIVDHIIQELGGQDRAISDWVRDQIVGLASRYGTRKGKRKRGVMSDAAFPVAGDILLYQTRGQAIREFIQKSIKSAEPPVVLLAHSLGGIACVDLLVATPLPAVTQLITVGSQAPLFYEMDCLTSMRVDESLPNTFPAWLNLYDLNDFLSYVGGPIFGTKVTDVEVASRQPFPESHSAYWSNPKTWKEIVKVLS